MIVFDLACDCGSFFEGWFDSHDDYQSQQDRELINCPQCGASATVHKVLSPVAFQKSRKQAPATSKTDSVTGEGKASEFASAALQVLCNISEFVEKNFEDVGTEFASKTLKMHYGVEEEKNIRGVVTPKEEQLLTEEGIDLLKIPMIDKSDLEKQ